MEHTVEMQSGPGKAETQPTKDQPETEVRVPAKIDLKSVLVGLSSAKSKAAPPSAKTPVNDVTSSAGLTSTSAASKSQAPPPKKTTSLSRLTATLLSSPPPSSSSSTTTATTTSTTTTTTSASSPSATATTAAETSVSSISASAECKNESQNVEEGESKNEEQDEPFVMTPAYERLARLLARKRENAAATAVAPTVASGSDDGTGEVDSEALPQQSHWSKLRTTVQIASVVKQRSKRRHNHHRQDSFLRKFSTRHNSNLDGDSDSEDNEAVTQEIEKEVEQKRLYRYVISPEGTFMMYWLLILTLAVLYNVWTCIAREAFREIQLEYTSFWISFDVICDLIYLVDVAVQFRTGYLEQGLLVYDSGKLSKNYMTSNDFKLDVVCLTPLDLIQLAIGWHPILRFPRFLKIYRTFRCVYMLESRTPYPNLFRVANLTHILFLGAHWFAAFFYLISEAENFVGAWTYPKPVGEFAGVTRKYLYSLFWSTLTLTTIGDLPQPTTNWEFVFVIFSYLIGVFIFATIVGQVGNVITNRNASRQEFERLLDGAKFYMQSHNVPKELQKRVQRWYDYVWSRGRLNGSLDIGSLGMLPDKLKTELALNVNLDTLKKVTIFQECQPEFLHDLVLKMRAHIFTPGDLICRRGEVAREMFIIADGVVEIISDRGTVLTSMSSGDFFGEIGILNLHGGINRRTADVRSLGYSELFVLSREDVLAALKDQPDAEHIIREYGEKRLKEIEAHNKRNSDPTPTPSPGTAPKKKNKPAETQNSLQVGPIKKNKPLRMSNLDKSPSQSKESLKSKTTSISKRLRELPLGRSIVTATSGGAGNNSRFHRLWKNNWSKIFSARQSAVDDENRKVSGTRARSGEKRRKSSSNSSSSPEGRTRKQGVAFSHDGDGGKEEAGGRNKTVDLQLTTGKAAVALPPSRKTLSNRLSGLMSQRKISHGAKYSAVKPDTSDSDSAYTDATSQPVTKPAEIAKKDSSMTDRRLGGFAGLLTATGFRRPPAKTSDSTTHSTQPVPLISLTVSSPPSSKHPESGASSGDVVVDTGNLATVNQSAIKTKSLSATIIIEDTNDDTSTTEPTNICWSQQQQQVHHGIYTTTSTTTTNNIELTKVKGPETGSISSLPGSISAMRSQLTSLPASSSVQAFSSSFGPASRGPFCPNAARSATTHSFTAFSSSSSSSSTPSSFYPGTGSSKVTSRPPITQSYSFSSPSSSPSFYPGGVGSLSTSSQSTPTVHHVVSTSASAKTTFTTTTTVATTTTTGLPSAPISGNKFSLLAGRRRGPQQAPGVRSCSLEEYRTSTSDSQPSSDMVTSSSSFWSPTPAAPPPSYYSSYSVSSSLMHPQVNRWIPGSGSTHASPLELTTRNSASTTASIENGALLSQTASSPIDANGKGRKEPVSSDKQWQASQVIKDIQRILDEKINELQRVYQGSIEQYSQVVRHQEDRILELERQLKNLQGKLRAFDAYKREEERYLLLYESDV